MKLRLNSSILISLSLITLSLGIFSIYQTKLKELQTLKNDKVIYQYNNIQPNKTQREFYEKELTEKCKASAQLSDIDNFKSELNKKIEASRENQKLYELEQLQDTPSSSLDIESGAYQDKFLYNNQLNQNRQNRLQSKYNLLSHTIHPYLGTPYVWGGTSMRGMDCSGFVQSVYKDLGYKLPRKSSYQSFEGITVPRDKLEPGDLLFFDTHSYRDSSDITTPRQEQLNYLDVVKGYKPNEVSHVGIYMGNGYMVHASSGDNKIMYTDINTYYYTVRFLYAKRIIK